MSYKEINKNPNAAIFDVLVKEFKGLLEVKENGSGEIELNSRRRTVRVLAELVDEDEPISHPVG